MSTKIELQRQHLIKTLLRMRRQIESRGDKGDPRYQKEYDSEIRKYESMLHGGNGGNFRNSSTTIRELHFNDWKDSDFQLLLEAVGETPVIDDDEWHLRFGHELGFFSKLLGKKGRPQ